MIRLSRSLRNPLSTSVSIKIPISAAAASHELEIYRMGTVCEIAMLYDCLIGRLEPNLIYCVYWKGRLLLLSYFRVVNV